MKVSTRILTTSLLLGATLLLAGCSPLPYQGSYDFYTEVIIIHDPGPGPCIPPGPEYPRPRPLPPRRTPLTRDQVTEQHPPRTKNPVPRLPSRDRVTKPSRGGTGTKPVQVAGGAVKRPPRKR